MTTPWKLPWHYLATTICLLEGKHSQSRLLCNSLAADLDDDTILPKKTDDVIGSVRRDGQHVLMSEIEKLGIDYAFQIEWDGDEVAPLDIRVRTMPDGAKNREYVLTPQIFSAGANATLYVPWPLFPGLPLSDCRAKIEAHAGGAVTSLDVTVDAAPRMYVDAALDTVDYLLAKCDATIQNPTKRATVDDTAEIKLGKLYGLGQFSVGEDKDAAPYETAILFDEGEMTVIMGTDDVRVGLEIAAWPCGAITGAERC